jgi:23S rRNA (adenine1618-N6)-methyltransferase
MWKASILTGLGFAQKAVWSRAARRNTARSEDTKMDEDEDEAALGVKIYCGEVVEGEVLKRVTIRWVKGVDSVLFESFCGMVKRKLDEL